MTSYSAHCTARSIAAVALAVLSAACGQPGSAMLELSGATMGTRYTIRVADCSSFDCTLIEPLIELRLIELNQRLSHWDPDSELSLLNRSAAADWQPVSSDLSNVVSYARLVNEQSAGAFDISVGRAVNAWGFGPEDTHGAPTAAAIQTARRHSGQQLFSYRAQPPAIRKLDPQLQLDLSALAKGYAVDQLSLILETLGSSNYLVEIGGELRLSGQRRDGEPWHIGVAQPQYQQAIEYVVTPGNNAIATSGDYHNYYMLDGERVSHTIDPANAAPVHHELASVSVISPRAMHADAWATALMVMGPEKGPAFAAQNDLAALFLVRDKQKKRAIQSPAFEAYLLKD